SDAITNNSRKIRIGDGTITVIEGQVDWTFPSDGRFKNHVNDLSLSGLSFIQKLRPVTYVFDNRKYEQHLMQNFPDSVKEIRLKEIDEILSRSSQQIQTGFIAQEVEQTCKELNFTFSGLHIPENDTDNYGLAYGSFVPLLVKGIQEQQVEIKVQRAIIEQQQTQITLMQQQLNVI